eukprot:scaffold62891_cov75-Phaeocystis_antarctica.AAC.1
MPGSERDYDLKPKKLVLAPPRLPAALPAGWRFERASSSRPSEVVLSHRGVHLYARRLDGTAMSTTCAGTRSSRRERARGGGVPVPLERRRGCARCTGAKAFTG